MDDQPTSRTRTVRVAGRALLAVLALLAVSAPSAAADSASVDAVADAGGGMLTATYTVTSTSGDPGVVIFPGGPPLGRNYSWFAYLAEEHPARACDPASANYLRQVEPIHEDAGTVTRTVTFRPFFPRQIKLCVFLDNTAGNRVVGERFADIPAGYGMQRSSAYNCLSFSRYSAQDYFWLYPDDPSGLDADHDGAACEENSGLAPGPRIPAEPLPSPSAPLPQAPAPLPDISCRDGIDNDGDARRDGADLDQPPRCDQVRPAPASIEPPARRVRPVRLICNKFVGRNGRNVAYRTRAPRRCKVWRANWAHYQALTFINASWTGWGRTTARARLTVTGNGGFRARASVKAYRLRADCSGRYRVYTRVALQAAGRTVVYRPDTCPD